jgi:hypothetical protein
MRTLKVTLILAVLMVMMPIISEAQEAAVTLEFNNAASALEAVQNYTKALQAGDVAKMDAQLHNDIMVYGLGGALDSLTIRNITPTVQTSTSIASRRNFTFLSRLPTTGTRVNGCCLGEPIP